MGVKVVAAVLLLINISSLVIGQIPIPRRPLGFVYKNASHSAPVHIDAFMDLACPDSKTAFPVIKRVADMYTDKSVRLKMYLFPLPYHRNAQFAATAAQVVYNHPMAEHSPDDSVFLWAQTAFANQMKWSDSMTMRMDYLKIQSLIASYSGSLGYNSQQFQKLMQDMTYDSDARIEWKYGCSRGVAGTPWFHINGVFVDADASWTTDDWKKVIDRLL